MAQLTVTFGFKLPWWTQAYLRALWLMAWLGAAIDTDKAVRRIASASLVYVNGKHSRLHG